MKKEIPVTETIAQEALLLFVLHDKVAERHGNLFEQSTVKSAVRAAKGVLEGKPQYNPKEWEVILIGWRQGSELHKVSKVIFPLDDYDKTTNPQIIEEVEE